MSRVEDDRDAARVAATMGAASSAVTEIGSGASEGGSAPGAGTCIWQAASRIRTAARRASGRIVPLEVAGMTDAQGGGFGKA